MGYEARSVLMVKGVDLQRLRTANVSSTTFSYSQQDRGRMLDLI